MKTAIRACAAVGLLMSAAVVSPQAASAAATQVAEWEMDEATGATKMIDDSGNDNTGTISSKVITGRTGHSGKAYEFKGDGGLVSVPDDSTLDPGSSAYTVSLYFKSSVKPSDSVGDYDLIRKGLSTSSGGDWKVEVLQSGKAYCHFRGSSRSVNLTGDSNVVDGSWHKILCRTSSSGTRLEVDGDREASTSKRPGTISNSSILTVGAKNDHEDETTGLLDEVEIVKG